MKKRSRNILIIVGIAVIAVVVVFANLRSSGADVYKVQVEEAKEGEIISEVTATGWMQAKTTVQISADVSAKIVELPVEEGDLVTKNQVLIRLDPTRYQAAVGQARASLAAAKAMEKSAEANVVEARQAFERYSDLYKNKLVSEEEFTRIKTGFEVAEANLESARYNTEQQQAFLDQRIDDLEKTVIRSPIDGTVTELNAEIGEIVMIGTMNNPGTVIMTVADLNTIEVEVEVDETDIAKVKLGQPAKIEVDAFPDTTFRGEVTEVGNAAIRGTSGSTDVAPNFLVKILLLDDVPEIKPGMTATADVTTAKREHATYVPIQAIVMRPEKIDTLEKAPEPEPESGDVMAAEVKDENSGAAASGGKEVKPKEIEGVFTVVDGSAKFVPVTTGISDQQNIEIVAGLNKGDKVVTGSYRVLRNLKNGDKVEIEKMFTQRDES